MAIFEKLHELQKSIRVPKTETNKFGGFRYRTAEQILEAIKFILPDGVAITLTDTIELLDGRPYAVKSEASILFGEETYSVFGWAMLGQHKGMGAEQATGTASSYARKYALCGLLAIGDGSIDPDELPTDCADKEHDTKVNTTKSDNKTKFERIFERAVQVLNEAEDLDVVFEQLKYKIRDTDGEKGVEAVCLAYDKVKGGAK